MEPLEKEGLPGGLPLPRPPRPLEDLGVPLEEGVSAPDPPPLELEE